MRSGMQRSITFAAKHPRTRSGLRCGTPYGRPKPPEALRWVVAMTDDGLVDHLIHILSGLSIDVVDHLVQTLEGLAEELASLDHDDVVKIVSAAASAAAAAAVKRARDGDRALSAADLDAAITRALAR